MSYLVFPRVRVQAANMLSASFLMGGPPVFAAYGLGEALCFHLGGGAKVTGMALIHHNREALGQSFYGVFSPQQRRAAAFTFGKSANGSDYSSKNPHALSLQPVACAHLRVSIIWKLEQVAGVMEAREFLHRARLSGGYERYFEANGKTYCHIIDPKTGYPAETDLTTVTVFCDSGIESDFLSTMIFLDGSENIGKYLNSDNFKIFAADKNKKLYISESKQSPIQYRSDRAY